MVKWILSTSAALILAFLFALYPISHTRDLSDKRMTRDTQIGFYDLLSSRKEVYDSRMDRVNNTILITFTSPEDSRFVLKGKLYRTHYDFGKQWYAWSPIYFSSTRNGLMIDSLVELMRGTGIWMQPLNSSQQPLAIGQSGSIFLYPLD